MAKLNTALLVALCTLAGVSSNATAAGVPIPARVPAKAPVPARPTPAPARPEPAAVKLPAAAAKPAPVAPTSAAPQSTSAAPQSTSAAPQATTPTPSTPQPAPVAPSAPPASVGIKEIYPTIPTGRTYRPVWDNGKTRTLRWHQTDPFDPLLTQTANAILDIDGKGVLSAHGDPDGSGTLVGQSVRIFQYDTTKQAKWLNVETTAYMMRVRETTSMSYQGFTIGARSEHQEVEVDKAALGHTYYVRLEYLSGKAYFVKEVGHHLPGGYVGSSSKMVFQGGFPTGKWIGLKFVVRNIENDTAVKLEAWVDVTDGKDGGTWTKVHEMVDRGDWLDSTGKSTGPAYLAPATSVFFRNDELENGGEARYKSWSIREIAPL
jgi:hypothetical protein